MSLIDILAYTVVVTAFVGAYLYIRWVRRLDFMYEEPEKGCLVFLVGLGGTLVLTAFLLSGRYGLAHLAPILFLAIAAAVLFFYLTFKG
jgi:NADH:ubiquinone oxidoreductase subunit 2 (subunit N)